MGLCSWSEDAKLLLLCPRPDGSCLVPAAFSRVYQLPNEKSLEGGAAEETRVDAGSPQWREPRALGGERRTDCNGGDPKLPVSILLDRSVAHSCCHLT